MTGTQPATALVGERVTEGFRPVELDTPRGAVALQWYDVPAARVAAAFVGGVGGGFDTPARDLYPLLCRELAASGIAALRVRFRDPADLSEATYDLLAGLAFLEHHGAVVLGVVGHSMGGAVAIQAAAQDPLVRTVVTLSTQGYGAEPVADFPAERSILLLHGADDAVLPPLASERVYALAHGPKRLKVLPGAGHVLDEVAVEVHADVREWLLERLSDEGT